MAFVSTLGAENANSYISVAEADTLIGELPQSDGIAEWINLISADKEKTLIASTFSIDPLPWKGGVCSASQSLAWPRRISYDRRTTSCSALPYDFKLAVAYVAAFMGQLGGYIQVAEGGGKANTSLEEAIPGLTPTDLEGYEKVSLGNGALELTLAQPGKIQTGSQYLPPFASDILSKYTTIINGITASKFNVPSAAGLRAPFISRGSLGKFREVDGRIYAAEGYSLLDLP
jgi:hypothetical protein